MPYTIWRRAQLLGETDLDFKHIVPGQRCGDLMPALEAEALLPTISYGSFTEFELRGPDGTVIPTEWIEIRDNGFMRSLIHAEPIEIDEYDECDELDFDVDFADRDFDELIHTDFPRYEIDLKLVDDASLP